MYAISEEEAIRFSPYGIASKVKRQKSRTLLCGGWN